uniref:Alpha-tectorin-like n=1 Tax=Seriola lalandi dorsalis TaxID=1841481 RepID=A0A3B4WPS3_SERLL
QLFLLTDSHHVSVPAGANTPPTETDISSCPVLYFGKLYTTIYVSKVCLRGPYLRFHCLHKKYFQCQITPLLIVIFPVRCVVYSTCTVTGPTVIDFNGHVSSVQDRCAYTLMSAAGLQLLATFQERRRKDVSFLERVILRLDGSGVDIHLGQGGNVQLNHTTLRLNSSAQLIHGVELSKDKSRVTAKVTFSNYSTSILFDGTTAQIHVKGPGSLQGLCVNSSSLSEVRLSEFSSSSCETQYSEPADGRIDCTMMTARCNLLKEAPFTSCHSHVDPEPHVTACTSVLCLYPAGDGLRCQFLEVYAQACSLHSNHTLEGWRSKASCSPPQDLCQDTSCSAHEFCGEDMSGRPRCLCRAGFASKYRTRGALGDPTVCRENSASVSLAACLLAEKGINHSVLHLNDHTCTGQMDEKTHMVTFGFNTSKPCGTVISVAKNKIIYSNTIKTDNSSTSGPISRQSLVNVNFSCFYSQPDVKSITVMQQIISGSWNYSLSMSMCADLACTQPIDFSKGVQLDQTIYMSIETDGLDGNLINMKTESCWATNNENGNGGLRYDLVKNGCSNPQDSTVMIIPNGKGTGSILVFRMFQFRGNNNKIFLHCKMKLCLKSSPSCQQVGRKKRSVRPDYEDENPAFVTVALGP